MNSDEKHLEPINDPLNPAPSKFAMPWCAIFGILLLSVAVFLLPGFKIIGALLCPSALSFGYWLCREDPKEPQLILHDWSLPSEFDLAKEMIRSSTARLYPIYSRCDAPIRQSRQSR